MNIPKQLYHGTKASNVPAILSQGLKAAFPAVYMTDDLVVATKFGEVVLVVSTANLDHKLLGTYHEMLCDILKTSDFWHYYGNIPASEVRVLKVGS